MQVVLARLCAEAIWGKSGFSCWSRWMSCISRASTSLFFMGTMWAKTPRRWISWVSRRVVDQNGYSKYFFVRVDDQNNSFARVRKAKLRIYPVKWQNRLYKLRLLSEMRCQECFLENFSFQMRAFKKNLLWGRLYQQPISFHTCLSSLSWDLVCWWISVTTGRCCHLTRSWLQTLDSKPCITELQSIWRIPPRKGWKW